MTSRSKSIDILKTIGIITIMLSHSRGLPYFVNYFRNYEVILLVMVSGMLYKDVEDCSFSWKYVRKRLNRIVIPTWAFLVIFLVVLFVASIVLHMPFPYSKRDIIESFTMTNGIGYVWIMLVYCLISMGLPMIWNNYNKLRKSNKQIFFYTVGVGIWAVYEIARRYLSGFSADILPAYVLKNTVLYFVSYSIIAWIGSFLGRKKAIVSLLIGFALTIVHFVIACLLFYATKAPVVLSTLKYPPSVIYVMYGMGVGLIIIGIVRLACEKELTQSMIITFISKESQWIYFNHIYMIFIWNQVVERDNWIFSFLFYVVGSVLLTWIQVTLVKALFANRSNGFSRFMIRTFC